METYGCKRNCVSKNILAGRLRVIGGAVGDGSRAASPCVDQRRIDG